MRWPGVLARAGGARVVSDGYVSNMMSKMTTMMMRRMTTGEFMTVGPLVGLANPHGTRTPRPGGRDPLTPLDKPTRLHFGLARKRTAPTGSGSSDLLSTARVFDSPRQ